MSKHPVAASWRNGVSAIAYEDRVGANHSLRDRQVRHSSSDIEENPGISQYDQA